jgi:hypothetical protein
LMKWTHLRCWNWRMCFSSTQEVSTKKGTCHFTPELCCCNRPRTHSQLENCNLVPPYPDCYSIIFSVVCFPPSPIPLLYIK